jgi:hypothetical protein
MPISESDQVRSAVDLARQAEELSAKLKAGSWESAQTLALISIAKSLSVIAGNATDPGSSGLR